MENNFRIIILAAGEGKRMAAGKAKVLVELAGKPLLLRLLDSVVESGVDSKPIVVIAAGERGEEVKQATSDYNVEYVVQEQQLGTGHAVQVCQEAAKDTENIMVLQGDHSLLTAKSIVNAAQVHSTDGNILTFMTTTVADFNDWRVAFVDLGRILRDQAKVIAIVEVADATDQQKLIMEVNPAYYCFKSDWLWQNIQKLETANAQGELYLPDLVAMAFKQDEKIDTIDIKPIEAIGINTPEQLREVERLLETQNK